MRIPSLKDYWLESNLYERFQTLVSLLLVLLIAVVVTMSVLQVITTLIGVVASGSDFFAYGAVKALLGQILLVLIALEFGHSLVLALKDRKIVFQIQGIILIGILAVIRKLVLVELDEVDTLSLFGMAAILVGFAALYWVVNQRIPTAD